MSVRAILHRHPLGYWAEVPALPGCVAFARNRDEALENIYDCVDGAVRTYRNGGREVPWQPDPGTVPSEGEVVELHAFWDDPERPPDPEFMEEVRKACESGDFITIEEMIRELEGTDPPSD